MTTVANPRRHTQPAGRVALGTRVSRYEQVSATLVALIVMLGFMAAVLLIIAMTRVFVARPVTPKLVMEGIGEGSGPGTGGGTGPGVGGRGDHAAGYARDLEPPGVEELPDVQEPQLADALAAVTDAVTSTTGIQQAYETYDGDQPLMGKGKGRGDSRGPGPLGEGGGGGRAPASDEIPPWERWEVRYSTTSSQDYARQLDFFNIELGAIHRKMPNIEYAGGLSGAPRKRSGIRDLEKRLYFVHPPNGALVALTTELLAKAAVVTDDRFLAQFYSQESFDRLLAVEQASLGGKSLTKVRKTIFGIRSAGGGFEFYVLRQDFLPGA